MEDVSKLKAFLCTDGYGAGTGDGAGSGYGDGYGSGYGAGSGYGDGYGYGAGAGAGDGYGDGDGYGSGYGTGYSYGAGAGTGYGAGAGTGYGAGDGAGYGYGLKSVNGEPVFSIDGVQTIIKKIKGNCARGFILRSDLTLEPCWVVKGNNCFAHGRTLREARDAMLEKMFDDMSEEERIAAFVEAHEKDKAYSDKDFFDWHHRLTGSCEMGRREFAREHGIEKLNGWRTVKEFIALCENAYGGSIIRKLKSFYE